MIMLRQHLSRKKSIIYFLKINYLFKLVLLVYGDFEFIKISRVKVPDRMLTM